MRKWGNIACPVFNMDYWLTILRLYYIRYIIKYRHTLFQIETEDSFESFLHSKVEQMMFYMMTVVYRNRSILTT